MDERQSAAPPKSRALNRADGAHGKARGKTALQPAAPHLLHRQNRLRLHPQTAILDIPSKNHEKGVQRRFINDIPR